MKITLAKQIGQRLKTAREERHLTQKDVGESLGIGRAAYANIENGRSLITVEHLLRIPSLLGYSVNYYLGIPTDKADNSTEVDLLNSFRRLSPIQQLQITQFLHSLHADIKSPIPLSPPPSLPQAEDIMNILEHLDQYEIHMIYDYVHWRAEEQNRRRKSSGKKEIAPEILQKWQKDLDTIEIFLATDEATPQHRKEVILWLKEYLDRLNSL